MNLEYEIKTNALIRTIDKKICTLTTDDIVYISQILLIHECEPMAQAERISEYLEVSYESIFDLL